MDLISCRGSTLTGTEEKRIIPIVIKKSGVMAIFKPGKPEDDLKRYRLVELLGIIYELTEILLHKRSGRKILKVVPTEQARP